MSSQLLDQLIRADTVNHAGLLKRLTARCGAAEAVHSHFKEIRRGIRIGIENFADQ